MGRQIKPCAFISTDSLQIIIWHRRLYLSTLPAGMPESDGIFTARNYLDGMRFIKKEMFETRAFSGYACHISVGVIPAQAGIYSSYQHDGCSPTRA